MKKRIGTRPLRSAILLLALVALFLVAGLAGAQGTTHATTWHVVAAGGAPMSSSAHQVNGTLGQVAIGPAGNPGGHAVGAGYWYGVRREAEGYKIYLPLVVKGG